MKLKQQLAPKLALGGNTGNSSPAERPPQPPSRRQIRRQVEELKMQVLELAEHQMDISIQILKHWIAENKK